MNKFKLFRCGHCKALVPLYIEMAKAGEDHDPKFVFAEVFFKIVI